MKVSIYKERLFSDYVKSGIALFLLLGPSIEIIYHVMHCLKYSRNFEMADLVAYLTGNNAGIGHVFQTVILWFLPLYLLVILAEDCIVEHKIGYKNILISKCGKKKYIKTHLKKSFIIGFLIVFCGIMFNLLLVHITFWGAIEDKGIVLDAESNLLSWLYQYPLLANIVFGIIVAWCAGLISAVGTMVAIVFHDRKLVYSITMVIWLVPVMMKKSLMLLFQPFSEYDIDTLLPIFFGVSIAYIVIILALYGKEVTNEKYKGI